MWTWWSACTVAQWPKRPLSKYHTKEFLHVLPILSYFICWFHVWHCFSSQHLGTLRNSCIAAICWTKSLDSSFLKAVLFYEFLLMVVHGLFHHQFMRGCWGLPRLISAPMTGICSPYMVAGPMSGTSTPEGQPQNEDAKQFDQFEPLSYDAP